MKRSSRFDWYINAKRPNLVYAKHNVTGDELVARSREEMMRKINKWDRENL